MDFLISPFKINITFQKEYIFIVAQTYISESIEIFTVT